MKWTAEEDDKLRSLISEGMGPTEIARQLDRPRGGVRHRMQALGLSPDRLSEGYPEPRNPAQALYHDLGYDTATALARDLEINPSQLGTYLRGDHLFSYGRIEEWAAKLGVALCCVGGVHWIVHVPEEEERENEEKEGGNDAT